MNIEDLSCECRGSNDTHRVGDINCYFQIIEDNDLVPLKLDKDDLWSVKLSKNIKPYIVSSWILYYNWNYRECDNFWIKPRNKRNI